MICPNCGFEVKKPGWAISFIGLLETTHAILRFYCRCGKRLWEVELTVKQALDVLNGGVGNGNQM